MVDWSPEREQLGRLDDALHQGWGARIVVAGLQKGGPAIQLGADALVRGEKAFQIQRSGILRIGDFRSEPVPALAIEATADKGNAAEVAQQRRGLGRLRTGGENAVPTSHRNPSISRE